MQQGTKKHIIPMDVRMSRISSDQADSWTQRTAWQEDGSMSPCLHESTHSHSIDSTDRWKLELNCGLRQYQRSGGQWLDEPDSPVT